MFKNKTSTIAAFVAGVFLAGGLAVYAATWQGTSTIRDGQIIEPSVIKGNFDYIYAKLQALEQGGNTDNSGGAMYANLGEDSYGNWGVPRVTNNSQACRSGELDNRYDEGGTGQYYDFGAGIAYECRPNENRTCYDNAFAANSQGNSLHAALAQRKVICRAQKYIIQKTN